MGEAVKKETQEIIEKGMEIIELPPPIAEEYVRKVDFGWEAVIKADPVLGPKLKELFLLSGILRVCHYFSINAHMRMR